MKFDRNTVLGFVILAALFIGYFYYTNKGQAALRKQKETEQARQDSIARSNAPKQDTVTMRKDSILNDSVSKMAKAGQFQAAIKDTGRLISVENEFIRITFTTKGGQPKMVELKKFKAPDSTLVKLAATKDDNISYRINTGSNNNGSTETSDLNFSKIDSVQNADGSKKISFTLQSSDSSGASITHEFIVKPADYMIDFNIKMNGADKLLVGGNLNLEWQYMAAQQEGSISFEKQNTQVGYQMNGSFDYNSIIKRSSKTFGEPVQWIGIRQRFFNTILVAKNNFTSGNMEWTVPPDSAKAIVKATTNMRIQLPVASTASVPLSIYYGPSDYKFLQSYNMKFEKLINLGQGMYAFVRPLNKFAIMPIFNQLQRWVGSYGLAIFLLTLFIRLIISPLTYKSYLSGAKMKVLRPEIAKLKEKIGDDKQQMSVAQMKLFREAGVNPLGGCIPALLQIPIFFALFSFFSSNVGLRGASFLWANDLSAPDKVIHFASKIPLLGDHLSIFTITACLTSFLISWYSMSMSPDQSNPVLKYMPYIFPVFLLFFFNNLPSALTWYYTVSNIVTLALQFIIQNYIIDHEKILLKMEENRKKPKTKSKWQERMEQMQEQQKKLKEAQQKNRR